MGCSAVPAIGVCQVCGQLCAHGIKQRTLRFAFPRNEWCGHRRPLCRGSSRSARVLTIPLAEDLVHDLGAPGQSGHDLMPVDQLGRRGLAVPGQQRDRLHRDTMSRQQRHERVPKLPRHPRVTQPSRPGDHPELPPHVVIILRRPDRRREHQPVILPQRSGRQPVLSLPHPMLPQRLRASARQRQRPAGLRRLRIAPGTIGPPHEHRKFLVIEPGLGDRLPLGADPCDDVIPAQRPDLLRPQPMLRWLPS
jgi:hypothetical protein